MNKANLTSLQVPPFHGLEHVLQILLGSYSVLTCGEMVTDAELKALQPQMLDPRLVMKKDGVEFKELYCPCGRSFDYLQYCHYITQ